MFVKFSLWSDKISVILKKQFTEFQSPFLAVIPIKFVFYNDHAYYVSKMGMARIIF